MKRAATALSACVALATPLSARAEEPSTALRLVYEASPGCPSAPSFRGQVVARTARVRFVDGEATDRVLFVSIVDEPGRTVGRLRVDELQGSSLARELSGASCDEVASALALIAALAFDPQAKIDPAPAPAAPKPAPAPAAPKPAPAAPRPASRAPTKDAPWRVTAGLQGRFVSGPLPGFWPQAGLFIGLDSRKPGWPSPSVRFTALTTWRNGYEAGDGNASFSFVGGALEGCPARWPLLATLDVRPCLGLEAAWMRSEGQLGLQARRADLLWLSLSPSGRLRWAPGGAFFLEGQAGLSIPLTPYRFVFEQPDVVIHKVPPLGGLAALSLGLSFL
jgi:hypothetical protein